MLVQILALSKYMLYNITSLRCSSASDKENEYQKSFIHQPWEDA